MIIGQKNGSAIGTPVERTTRYLLLLHLPDELVRTLTWDQGKELSSHVQFSVDSGVAVYFCDPHSPWQRGLEREHQRPAPLVLP